jgi:phage baseplate assembly protein W|tara:strand:- start:38 stop:436 length:399 start_codon:yes stop_codon:yes gene_type:complete
MQGIGLLLPLSIDSRHGTYTLITKYHDEVKQNFKNLVLTNPGERIMNPDFGVGVRRFLFENRADASHQIEKRLYEQVGKYMPYVVIENVFFGEVDDKNIELLDHHVLSVQIIFSVPSMNFESALVIDSEDVA